MTGFCSGIGAVWFPVLHLTGLLRRLAMTMYVAVIASLRSNPEKAKFQWL